MRKTEKIRRVFFELKSALDGEMTAREILEGASLIVEASEDSLYEPAANEPNGRVLFSELPVHLVFENWSWRVLDGDPLAEVEDLPRMPTEALIEHCLRMAA